jgi:hypothetical protein
MGRVALRQGVSDVHDLTLDAAGRLARRVRPSCMGGVRMGGGQCSTRSLSACRATPARVKGDIAPAGGEQVVGWPTNPRSGSFFHMGWCGWVSGGSGVRAVSSARWRLRRARAPLATGRPCRCGRSVQCGRVARFGREASIPRPIKCISGQVRRFLRVMANCSNTGWCYSIAVANFFEE